MASYRPGSGFLPNPSSPLLEQQKVREEQQVLLDLSAAFDTVEYEILFQRLETVCGIAGTALAWIKSYLADRKQAIKCGGAISATSNLTCGVPQRSVLGPLLFLVYTIGLDDDSRVMT